MKLQDLFEGISPILYHYTFVEGLYGIIKDNSFKLRSYFGVRGEKESGSKRKKIKVFYFSTARHKLGGFQQLLGKSEKGTGEVMLVLDGRKLGQKYEGHSVNYFSAGYSFGSSVKSPAEKEAEDRIFNDKPRIPKANKYIKEVHIALYNQDKSPIILSKLRKALIKLKKFNIPYWLYDNKQAFKLLNKNKSINIPEKIFLARATGREVEYDYFKFAGEEARERKDAFNTNSNEMLNLVLDLYYGNKESDIKSDKGKFFLKRLKKHNDDNVLDSIDKNINGADSDLAAKVVNIIKKEGMQDDVKLYKFKTLLADKWRRVLGLKVYGEDS